MEDVNVMYMGKKSHEWKDVQLFNNRVAAKGNGVFTPPVINKLRGVNPTEEVNKLAMCMSVMLGHGKNGPFNIATNGDSAATMSSFINTILGSRNLAGTSDLTSYCHAGKRIFTFSNSERVETRTFSQNEFYLEIPTPETGSKQKNMYISFARTLINVVNRNDTGSSPKEHNLGPLSAAFCGNHVEVTGLRTDVTAFNTSRKFRSIGCSESAVPQAADNIPNRISRKAPTSSLRCNSPQDISRSEILLSRIWMATGLSCAAYLAIAGNRVEDVLLAVSPYLVF